MSPQTAHNCDGAKAEVDGEDVEVDALLEVLGSVLGMAPIRLWVRSLLLLRVEVLLLFRQLGELEAELDALGMVLPMYNWANFGLSLLDVDSERWTGRDCWRWIRCVMSDMFGNDGSE